MGCVRCCSQFIHDFVSLYLPVLSFCRSRSTAAVCPGLQAQILSCYKENGSRTLTCSDLAKEYLQCINAAKKVRGLWKVEGMWSIVNDPKDRKSITTQHAFNSQQNTPDILPSHGKHQFILTLMAATHLKKVCSISSSFSKLSVNIRKHQLLGF